MRRDLRELVEARAVVRLEHVDEVGDEVFVEHQAVAEHLEGVLARVGIGGRLVRLPAGAAAPPAAARRRAPWRAKSARAKSSSWKPSSRPSGSESPAASAQRRTKSGTLTFFSAACRLIAAFLGRFAAEGNALGRGECTLAQGVHVFEVKVAKLHRDAPKFQK